jgi:hypothetical protein
VSDVLDLEKEPSATLSDVLSEGVVAVAQVIKTHEKDQKYRDDEEQQDGEGIFALHFGWWWYGWWW